MNIFLDDYDRQVFMRLLESLDTRFQVTLNAYALMDTHYHLLTTPQDDQLPTAMKSLATRYTLYFNKRYGRCGTPWSERYGARQVADERYALTCLRYIDQNPVRATLVTSADQYKWSSCRAYASGTFPDWLTPHPVYVALASTPGERESSYRTLFSRPLTTEQLVEQRRG